MAQRLEEGLGGDAGSVDVRGVSALDELVLRVVALRGGGGDARVRRAARRRRDRVRRGGGRDALVPKFADVVSVCIHLNAKEEGRKKAHQVEVPYTPMGRSFSASQLVNLPSTLR